MLALETALISEQLREECNNAFEAWEKGFSEKLVKGGFARERANELGIIIQVMIEGALDQFLNKKRHDAVATRGKANTNLVKSVNELDIYIEKFIWTGLNILRVKVIL